MTCRRTNAARQVVDRQDAARKQIRLVTLDKPVDEDLVEATTLLPRFAPEATTISHGVTASNSLSSNDLVLYTVGTHHPLPFILPLDPFQALHARVLPELLPPQLQLGLYSLAACHVLPH